MRAANSAGPAGVGDHSLRHHDPAVGGLGVVAVAGECGQFGLRPERLGTEPDAEQRRLVRVRPLSCFLQDLVGIGPPPFPQRELRDVRLKDAETVVGTHSLARRVQVCSRGVEVAPPGLEVGPEQGIHVGKACRGCAECGSAYEVGLIPLPESEQGLDVVGSQDLR